MKKLFSVVLMFPFIVIALLNFSVRSALTAESLNMGLVGTNDLQARSAYQPIIQRQGNRWILYAGHHALGTNPVTGAPLPSFNPLTGVNEPNGVSIVDVTNPAAPVYLKHLPVGTTGNGGAQMLRVCPGATLPISNTKFYLLRSYANSAHEIWDVTNPSAPVGVRTVAGGNPVIGAGIGQPGALAGTHKSWWECDTGIAYIVGRRDTDTAAGWRPGNHIFVFDLKDPANPIFIRDWALDGQQPGGQLPPHFDAIPSIHGPISTGPAGNRVYFAYGTGDNGVMQIVDRSKLLSNTIPVTDFTSAEVGRWVMNPINGAHTSFPLGKFQIADWEFNEGSERDFVAVVSEETDNECTGPRHLTYFVDVTDEGRPQSQSNHQVLASSSPFNFCDRGGRFGPHSTNESFSPPFYQKIVFIAYFNAGVRAVDIRDPFRPKEVGFYIPDATANTDFRCATINGVRDCQQAIQTNNVETDERGYIYTNDRANTGLHIYQLTGPANRILKD
jgi:LVIVD repeat